MRSRLALEHLSVARSALASFIMADRWPYAFQRQRVSCVDRDVCECDGARSAPKKKIEFFFGQT